MKKLAVTILLAPMLAQATLTPNMPGRGAQKIALDRGEICYIPNRLEGSKYSKKDLQREMDLCAMNIGTSAAVCGKTESTNPALEFFEVEEGMTAAQIEAKNCFQQEAGKEKGENAFKKLAKYKLSTSCSYTPSLLAYYHTSRFLGNINQVPPVVLRTVHAETHTAIGNKTYNLIKDKQSLIAQTWAGLLSILTKKQAHAKSTNVFTDDYNYSFGALQMNPSKEEKYSELFSGGKDQYQRTAMFKGADKALDSANAGVKGYIAGIGSGNPAFIALKDSQAIKFSSFNQSNAQKVLTMQNVADMILLDSMLSQQDRLGNLHYTIEPYAIVTDATGKTKVDKLDSLSKKDLAAGKTYPTGTLMLKKMMMKDNDCGVAKENHIKNGKLLELVRHFNPETFEKLLNLYKLINTVQGQEYFKLETGMTAADVGTFKINVGYAVNVLAKTCQEGKLSLDLDLDSAFTNQAAPDCRAMIQAAKQ